MVRKILTIAESDCSGGTGIQADIKTITAHKMYAMSVVTAITAQNTTGVFGVVDTAPEFVAAQIDSVFKDIVPDAVKIGMVLNSGIIDVIVDKLQEYKVRKVVVDPVMVSMSSQNLITDETKATLIQKLLPIASVITPNIAEAQLLCGFEIKNENDMVRAGEYIETTSNVPVLIKGGHLITDDAIDLLYSHPEKLDWYRAPIIDNENTHGAGCTLASAIACNLADEQPLDIAVKHAKDYLTKVLQTNVNLGEGRGPLHHAYIL